MKIPGILDAIGILSGASLALCGLPQTIEVVVAGSAAGISAAFLWMWFLGEVGMVIYVIFKLGGDRPLLFNYFFNIFIITPMIYYKYFPIS